MVGQSTAAIKMTLRQRYQNARRGLIRAAQKGAGGAMTRTSQKCITARLRLARRQAKQLKDEVAAVVSALADPRVGWLARALLVLVIAYALSPIDLIPDFIPVIGMLDDLVIVPAGIALAIRLMPEGVLDEHRRRVRLRSQDAATSQGIWLRRLGAVLVVVAWVATALVILIALDGSGWLSAA